MSQRPILIVEDSTDDAELIIRSLRRAQVTNEIVIAKDGEEALQYLFGPEASSSSCLPQVIFLDLKLPKLSGFDVLRELRAHPETQWLPVIILSSSNEPEDIERSYKEGANSYIRKYASFKQFAECMQQTAEYWTALNRPV